MAGEHTDWKHDTRPLVPVAPNLSMHKTLRYVARSMETQSPHVSDGPEVQDPSPTSTVTWFIGLSEVGIRLSSPAAGNLRNLNLTSDFLAGN
ncbi:hypothetical protein GE21DRAFT_4175 [Neurospora crassa]|uniref:Uncharacterized protein n=1 Tax=Neurospora crassa (strain ATCC 24698 / 74-OR23-1A / CBS 708.71 / DSM 1257 / FGSC 987) TaxID=367110 RepID=U9W312_NEUCR|nr:hypothetical protein NCU16645 [Neurospora crassa OR74A]ESA43197.1 hypothetical protein NCU16645 [Neurospora crassa OR74A]KHE87026.1 hypothetical protein GE21DRAFT_4175 [Neurospora crassa]|eukprot:XP_011394033.1 hypothetical protein NCU16645 [Neurospora crassa OR74A]